MRGIVLDEPDVLDRIHAGDADAFGALFDLHHDRVFRQALRLTASVHDAEDITGVVFLEAWRRRDSLRVVNGSVIGWLLVTTNFVFRNHLRSKRRYRDALAHLPLPVNAPDHSDAVDDRIDTDARRSAVRAALAGLPKRDQDIITLCIFEEQSTADAAEALGIAVGTVKSRLSRAKTRLAAALEGTGGLDTTTTTNGGER